MKFTQLTKEQIALLDNDIKIEVYINAEDFEDVTEFDPYQGFDFYFNKGMIGYCGNLYRIKYEDLRIPVCEYPEITTDFGDPIQCEIDKFIPQLIVGLLWHLWENDERYVLLIEEYEALISGYIIKDADDFILSEGNQFENFSLGMFIDLVIADN
jgi:hypothetical protein